VPDAINVGPGAVRVVRPPPQDLAPQGLAVWRDPALARLTTICLGITDYQLGSGAAAWYVKAVMIEIERRAPSNPKDVIELMARVCRQSTAQYWRTILDDTRCS
jgi:hypothetical protein